MIILVDNLLRLRYNAQCKSKVDKLAHEIVCTKEKRKSCGDVETYEHEDSTRETAEVPNYLRI